MTSRRLLILPALILILAPFWAHHFQTLADQNLFMTPDSLVILGAALLTGALLELFLPDHSCPSFQPTVAWIRNNFLWISVCFLSILFIGLVITNKYILKSFMNSADEHSCYFLAECIRHGKFWATPHPLSDFFEMVHVGNKNGKWFSVYPPGWPALMALGLKLHVLNYLNPVLATISLVLFHHVGKKLFGSLTSALGILFMSITPFFIFNSASYFSHTACLFMVAIFLFSYFKWNESQNKAWAALTALAVGYGLGTRYLTMASIAAPFLFYRLFRLVTRKQKWQGSDTVFIVIFLVMWFLNFYYNLTITGNPFDAPNHYHHSWERLGFKKDYTILTAVIFIVARFFYLIDWVPATFVVFYLIWLFQKSGAKIEQKLFSYGFFYSIIGYLFYYSWGGNQYGPRYYFEGIPFLFLAFSDELVRRWKAGSAGLRKFMLGTILVSLVGNAYLFQKQARLFERVSSQRKALYDLAERSIHKPSVVFVRGFLGDALVMSEEDAIRNPPQLQGKILYARDLKGRNKKLKQYYPDREFYLGSYDRGRKLPKLEPYENSE